jgi:hypothetical protein
MTRTGIGGIDPGTAIDKLLAPYNGAPHHKTTGY